MEELLLSLLQKGGPLGVLITVVISLVATGLLARQKGWFALGDKTRGVGHDDISSINRKIGDITQRVKHVEDDLKHRPTRNEFHELDKANALMEVRLKSIDRGVQATSEAVANINNFMREAALRLKGDKQ